MKAKKKLNELISFNKQTLDNYTPEKYLEKFPQLFTEESLKKYHFILVILDNNGIVKSLTPFKKELIILLKQQGFHFFCFKTRKAYVLVSREYDDQYLVKKLAQIKPLQR